SGLRKKREQLRSATTKPRRKASPVATPRDCRTVPRKLVADAGSGGDSGGDAQSTCLFEPVIKIGGGARRIQPQFCIRRRREPRRDFLCRDSRTQVGRLAHLSWPPQRQSP